MSGDQRILSIAAEITECSDRQIPDLLMRLRDIILSAPSGTPEAGRLKQEVYDYEVLQFLLLFLRQDFSRVKGSWDTGVKLCDLTNKILAGVTPTDPHVFESTTLVEFSENMMVLARRIQDRYVMSLEPKSLVTESSPSELLQIFQSLLELIQKYLLSHNKLIVRCITSPWFLQLFVTDDEETAILMVKFLQFLVTHKNDMLAHVEDKLLYSILDEMTYTLSVTKSSAWAGATVRCVLKICQVFPPLIDSLSQRYKGLRLIVTKWGTRSAFARDLNELIFLLDAGTAQRAQPERYHVAAQRIQAVWRNFAARARLRRQSDSAAKIQRLFRNYSIRREQSEARRKACLALEHQVALARRRHFREKLEREIELMETLPAPIVNLHKRREQTAAATRIQSHWRGHVARQGMDSKRQAMLQFRAAVRIQRCVRKWLARLDSRRKEPPAFQRPPGLTDARRVELQHVIEDWRDSHRPIERTHEEQEELYTHAQTLLQRHIYRSKQTRRKEQERLATLARIDTDIELLLSAPKLDAAADAVAKDHFVCRSVPIATRAKMLHQERMRKLRLPWWKQLQHLDDEDEGTYVIDKQDVIVIDGKVM